MFSVFGCLVFECLLYFRTPFANVVEDKCPAKSKLIKRKLMGSDFQSNNEAHLKLVKDMGITIIALTDGRVQLLHTFANVRVLSILRVTLRVSLNDKC